MATGYISSYLNTAGNRRRSRGLLGIALLGWALWPAAAIAYDPATGDFSKESPFDIRILSYNVERFFIDDPSKDAAFHRIFQALAPDILVLVEIGSDTAEAAIPGRLSTVLPYGAGAWEIHGGIDTFGTRTVIASRFPLLLKRVDTIPASSTRGVTIALADLPDALYPKDIYLLAVHLKCCGEPGGSEDDSRQRSADAIASWLGDARQPGGNITLPDYTPMIALGDFNLVGGPQPELTLLTGDIIDTLTFGPDVKGDWDVSDMTDLIPRDPYTNDPDTWPSDSSSPYSRLDRFIYTDSAVTPAARFVLNTDSMSGSQLANAGLLANDTHASSTADHLPIVMDLRLFIDCNENGENDALDIINGVSADCNSNGVPDECDIDDGTSEDGNGDGVPDECFTGSDCNNNGVDDAVDIFSGASADCNANSVPDECDIAGDTSHDCNNTDVPDECGEGPDCNANGFLDACDLAAGTSRDCNGTGVPDDCELDIIPYSAESATLSPIGINQPKAFAMTAPPPPFSDVRLDFNSYADYGQPDEYIDIFVNGVYVGKVFDDAQQCVPEDRTLFVPAATWNSAVGGGNATVAMQPSARVNPTYCVPFTFISVAVSYSVAGENDCNDNGVPDVCDMAGGTGHDCENDGVMDACQTDCNGNGIGDGCDLTAGTSLDCNGTTIPDECEGMAPADFNADGTVNLIDFAAFVDCLSGPGGLPDPPLQGCASFCIQVFDQDEDGSVGLGDFGEFQQRFTTP